MKNVRTILVDFVIVVLTSMLSGQAPSAGKLAVTGDVVTPMELTLDDLLKMPRATVRTPGNRGACTEV
jgi:DMSO/TMAO reductase YedYZ molybdopterin-dependent catalytic subunit